MENKPKLTIPKSQLDKVIELITLLCIMFCFVYPAMYYGSLPEEVPMHFNYKGEVDNYGNKSSVWGLGIIALLVCYGLYKLNNNPHWFNYNVKIKKENAEENYKNAQKMMRYINLGCSLLFALISYQVITIALNPNQELANWPIYLIYVIIGLMTFVPIVLVIISIFQKND